MTLAVEPGSGKVEGRPRSVNESQDILVETNGVGEIAGGDIVVVKHTDAHAHGLLLRTPAVEVSKTTVKTR
jgi:hypothetical protein